MLKETIKKIFSESPEYSQLVPVLEKEILHHDIFEVLLQLGALEQLTFIGGTSLRLCYHSPRLSEDLDFNGGHDFSVKKLSGLDDELKSYLNHKYETNVFVSTPNDLVEGNTVTWKISIERESNRPDIPNQKVHIDIFSIPSFDVQKRPLTNHYPIPAPTEGLLVPVQSLEEALVDKLIALAYRTRRIKPRDTFDIVWLTQKGITLESPLLLQKLSAREKSIEAFKELLNIQTNKLKSEDLVKCDFEMEMSRFLPANYKSRTIDNPDYWQLVVNEINHLTKMISN